MTDPVPSKERDISVAELREAGYFANDPTYLVRIAGLAAAEIERLETALRGIQSCSTCEACRGAATLALGGATPEPRPEFDIELPDGDSRQVKVWFTEKRPDGKWRISIDVSSAQPPGAGQ